MLRLIREAARGTGRTRTNPLVAAGVVEDGELTTLAYHEEYGGPHAEQALLEKVSTEDVHTLFCTLEPCIHHGKTPPCLNQLVDRGIERVVLAHHDPHLAVRGKGIEALRRLGVDVEVGVASSEYRWVNRAYFNGVRTGMPWMEVKAAMSADGYIAPLSGESRWITGEQSRDFGHRLRSRVDGVMIGANTLRQDDPRLTDRVTDADRQPMAIVVCRELDELPLESHLLTERSSDTILVCPPDQPADLLEMLEQREVSIVETDLNDGTVNWKQLLPRLRRHGFGRILVEGGGFLVGRMLQAGWVNESHLFYSGKVFGEGTGAFQLGSPPVEVSDSELGRLIRQDRFGEDVYANRLHGATNPDQLLDGYESWSQWLNTAMSSQSEVSE